MEEFHKKILEYWAFRKQLENDINGSPNFNPSEDCFLIEEIYMKEFEKNNNYPNLSNSFQNVKELEKKIAIINDFNDAIKHINSDIKLKLVSKRIFELMDFKNILKNNNMVNYYCGNKILIIEFKINEGNKSILISNYSKDIQSKNNIYIINKSKELYKNILSKKTNLNNLNNEEIFSFNNYIEKDKVNISQKNIKFKKINKLPKNYMKHLNYNTYNPDYSNISTTNNITNPTIKETKEIDDQDSFKKDLIEIFIYIFYYENICYEKKANIFNNKEKYYIINPNWIDAYKKYYNYIQLENLLKKEFKDINFFDLDKSINDIAINCLKNKNILNFGKKDLTQELKKNILYITEKHYDIIHLSKGLIIPSKIMNRIKNIHNISIYPNYFDFNNNNIYFIKNNKIIVGNYNDIPKILTKFVFNYKDGIIMSEIKIIKSYGINKYIKLRKCNENIKDLQILRNENQEEIGKFFIVNQIKKNNSINKSKSLKKSQTIIKKKANPYILRGRIGNLNKCSKKNENSQISINLQNLNYQNFNTSNNNLSTFDNEDIKKTTEQNLNNKNLEVNLVNEQQNNAKISNDLKNKNLEIKKLKEKFSKLEKENQQLKNMNLKYQQELKKALNTINNYKKKEEEDLKKKNELKNEFYQKENDFNKKMDFLEDKEKLIEKENMVIENKKKEFQKDIGNNKRIKQENNDLIKRKNELEKQIKEKEEQLNNLNKKILQKQNEINQNNQNINNNNISQNAMDHSKTIEPNILIKNIENNRKNNQINNYQIKNNLMNDSQKNNMPMNNNPINTNLVMNINGMKNNNIGMNNNNLMNNNNFWMNNNNNNIVMKNNNFDMNNMNNFGNNFGKNNNNIVMNNNNIGMNNNNNNYFGINNNNIGINYINNNNFGMNNNIIGKQNQNMKLNYNNINQINHNNNRNNIQNPKKKKEPNPIILYKLPPLVGLNNIGSTCFKNAVLQCLSQTESLANYFLKESSKEAIFNNNIAKQKKNAIQLCPAFYELIQNLWSKNGIKSYSPQSFMNLIDELSKDDILKFRTGEAGDAKDFIIFLLEQFHKELQKPLKKK